MTESEPARWVGRRERREDRITPSRVAAWRATLDRPADAPADGDPAPPGFHWALFPSPVATSALGDDGHARTGDFLPAVALPRRMWAGSRLAFHRPLRVGERVARESTVAAVAEKAGRRGPLLLVTVHHRVTGDGGEPALDEEQDIVYRAGGAVPAPAPAPSPAPPPAAWRREVRPSEALLFRFSALTFNAHRIHYDRRYAESVEGYPGLVVHGPLVAALLLDLLAERLPGAAVERFRFRAVRPTFDVSPFDVCGAPGDAAGGPARLWSTDNAGDTAVEAEAWTR